MVDVVHSGSQIDVLKSLDEGVTRVPAQFFQMDRVRFELTVAMYSESSVELFQLFVKK